MPRALQLIALVAAMFLVVLIGRSFEPDEDWVAVKDMVQQDFPEVEQISVTALSTWLDSGDTPPLLLDVRQEDEYLVSHLSGAVRVDPDVEDLEVLGGIAPDTPIVAYCSVGYRSSALAERLRRQGHRRVMNLEGSIFEWANTGHPVVRGDTEVRQVHPYNERWGRLLDSRLHAYEAD